MWDTVRIEIADASQVSVARRQATELATQLGFDDSLVGTAALLAVEAASNVFKHAGQGELLFGARPGAHAQLEIMAIDSGPGFNAARAGEDGYSTSGTLGGGLGAMQRVATEFSVYSLPGRGSVARMLLRAGPPPSSGPADAFEVGAVSVAMPGQPVCGDAWTFRTEGRQGVFVVVDGLGHGSEAHRAAALAVREPPPPDRPPEHLLERAHAELRITRGAAMSVMTLDLDTGRARFSGVGNVAGMLVSPSATKRMVSVAGIVGHNMRKVQGFDYPVQGPSVMVMYSDGLGTHWNLSDYPGLLDEPPAIIAAVLYRDHSRRRDDVSVLVVKCEAPSGASA
jgi:anti-sigma regulatory factor (Ser/Thr protein kinase)